MKVVAKRAAIKARRDESFGWYWLGWAVLSLVAFLLPELWVLTHGRIDLTLSDTVDRTAASHRWFGWLIAVLLVIAAAGAAFLGTVHFHLFPGH